jgi:hypothetical protein
MVMDWDELVDSALTNRFVRKLTLNPLISSIVVVLIMLLIVYLVYWKYVDDWSDMGISLVKVGIYGYLGTLLISYIHHKNMERDFEKRTDSAGEDQVMAQVREVNRQMAEKTEPAVAPPVAAPIPAPTGVEPMEVSFKISKPAPEPAPAVVSPSKSRVQLVSPEAPKGKRAIRTAI